MSLNFKIEISTQIGKVGPDTCDVRAHHWLRKWLTPMKYLEITISFCSKLIKTHYPIELGDAIAPTKCFAFRANPQFTSSHAEPIIAL